MKIEGGEEGLQQLPMYDKYIALTRILKGKIGMVKDIIFSFLQYLLIPLSRTLATSLFVMLKLNCQPMQLLLEMIYDVQNYLV